MKVKLNEYLYILQLFLDKEIQENYNYATLFRSRSTVIDMIKFYSIDAEYHEYLRSVILIPIISKLNQAADGHGQPDVIELSEFLLKTIIDNFQKCPLKIIYTCNMLKRHVSRKYFDHWREIVGGFFFLRIVCPALTFPTSCFLEHEWALIESNHAQRQTLKKDLLEIAKFIQQLSNSIDKNNSNNLFNNIIAGRNQQQRLKLQQQSDKIISILEEISAYHCKFIDETAMTLNTDIFERMMKESEELVEQSKAELISGNTLEIRKIKDLERIMGPIKESYDKRPSSSKQDDKTDDNNKITLIEKGRSKSKSKLLIKRISSFKLT